jgi:ABC-type branched-subunit amino acid transport system substrate-binding protein
MKPKNVWRILSVTALLALLAVMAIACGDDDDEDGGEGTPTPAGATTPAGEATPTPGPAQPGDAGIPSDPRDVAGLEGLFELDDGLAMWSERPADEDRTGVTDDKIILGRTTGLTGFIAAYEAVWGPYVQAVIKGINDAGGIHGRHLELRIKDDASGGPEGVQVTKELVESDEVFAFFFNIGSPTHNAVAEYLDQKKVPNLFYLDGSNASMEPTSPYQFNGQASDILSGAGLVDAVAKVNPDAKIAVVYMNFPASQAGLEGIRYEAEKLGMEIVGEFPHESTQTDLTSQAQQVVDSGADYLIYHGASVGSYSIIKALREGFGSDITVAQWGALPTGDPTVDVALDGSLTVRYQDDPYLNTNKELWAKLAEYGTATGTTYFPVATTIGVNALEHLVRALELAGPDLTREGLIEALETGFTGDWTCNMCLAPTILGPQDHWVNEHWATVKWVQADGHWTNLGIVNTETSEGKGLRGNYPDTPCAANTCPWKE